MNIKFSGHNIEITDALREITAKKFAKLERFYSAINEVHVIFRVDKTIQSLEVSLNVWKNHIHAHAESEVLYDAIDDVVEKLYRQLEKIKEKMHDHHRGHSEE